MYVKALDMFNIWCDALIENGEDIDEFLRVDNELIKTRGGWPNHLSYYTPPSLEAHPTDGPDDSDYLHNQYSTLDLYNDIFGTSLRSQWGEGVLNIDEGDLLWLFYGANMSLMSTTYLRSCYSVWTGLHHQISHLSCDAVNDIFYAIFRPMQQEDDGLEVD